MENKKIFILVFMMVFLIFQNIFLISANCLKEVKIEVGVYDKVRIGEEISFVRSAFQPEGSGIIQEGDALLIESLFVKKEKGCNENDSSIRFSLGYSFHNLSNKSFEISLPFTSEGNYLISSLKLKDPDNPRTIPQANLLIPYINLNTGGEEHPLNYLTLDEKGEFIIFISDDINYFQKITNEDSNIQEVNVLDRVDVAQLETLQQLKEDSTTSSKILIGIGVLTLFAQIIVLIFMKKQLKKMDEHYDEQNSKEDKREEEKQLGLLRNMLSEFKFLEKNLEAYKETFSKKRHYPFYELWNIDVAFYLRTLNHIVKGEETTKLKENLMFLKNKLLIIINMKMESQKEEEREQNRFIQIKIESIRKGIIEIITKDLLPLLTKSKRAIKKFLES